MKHKKELSLSIACFLLSFLCFMAWNQERDENLAAKICPAVLRLHVIGASNSDQDQQVKLQVKSFVVKQISSWNASSKDELGASRSRTVRQSAGRHPLLRRVGGLAFPWV